MYLLALARPARALLLGAALSMLTPLLPAGSTRHVSARAMPPLSPYDKAQRMREALSGRDRQQRTRRDYERVLEAYRAVYHGNPASLKADASVAAVADLLADEGRVFDDDKALHDAIGQYEFLRHQYPASRLASNALLTEAAIYHRDISDRSEAKKKYQQFLQSYPHSPLADQAREGLKEMRGQEVAAKHLSRSKKSTTVVVDDGPAATTSGIGAMNTEHIGKADQSANETSPSTPPSAQIPLTKAKPAPAPAIILPRPIRPEASATSSETSIATPARPRHGKPPLVTSIRHWSTNVYTRVAIDLDEEVQYEAARVPNPDRIFFDLHGVKLSPELIGRSVEVTDDGYLKKIRAAQFSSDVTRIVLDVSDVSDYSAFLLPNPYRLIIDIHGRKLGSPSPVEIAAVPHPTPPAGRTTARGTVPSSAPQPLSSGPMGSSNNSASRRQPTPSDPQPSTTRVLSSARGTPAETDSSPTSTTRPTSFPTQAAPETLPKKIAGQTKSSSLDEVAALSQQEDRVKATTHPTTAPISASVAGTTPAPQQVATNPAEVLSGGKSRTRKRSSTGRAEEPLSSASDLDTLASSTHEATPASNGQRSLVRALGLKIGRIVVDAGHGGHDSGTLGPEGIEEKEVVLDVALRLGKLLKQRLGADVIYTRDDDTFIPLETRTAIANKAQADLFISVHANSSHDSTARGVETYYLNFTASPDALEVAARENSVSNQSIHQLSDLVKKITLKDKIDESREFAGDVQQSLYSGLEDGNRGLKDRGVKKAPFVVLIGANMPSILAEISFLTNPDDARELRDPNYRQRIAESLYRGVSKYIGGLSGVRLPIGNPRASGN